VSRPLRVAGIVMEAGQQDLLGLSRIKFQGLIAAELAGAGYRLADSEALSPGEPGLPALTLIGSVKEEFCDDEASPQCRVAIQWELQDARGIAVYRTITRAVAQASTLDELRRGLVEGALRSLLQRRRFPLQLTEESRPSAPAAVGPLGFKQCRRPLMSLPDAARAAAASFVFVEAGSSLAAGAIVSGDGLILTVASNLDENAPLRVRFSAEQTLPAKIVVLDRKADVALLHVDAHTDATCLAIRESPLSAGQAVFGINSELSEDRAFSLAGGVVQPAQKDEAAGVLRVDPLLARAPGGALLDAQGRLAGIVPAGAVRAQHGGEALEVSSLLALLKLRPAAITDPRLVHEEAGPTPAVGYVRDRDDPPFVLVKRYTYGTSPTAHRLRTVGVVTAGVGAFAVAATWATFRTSRDLSPSAHNRFVVLNDIGWALLGLGVVGFGVSYAWPEAHDMVGVQSARAETCPHLFAGLTAGGFGVAGSL